MENAMAEKCTHLDQIKITNTEKNFCEECLTCGHVGCCDSSPNHHASKHYRETDHPLMRSIEPGESWVWCFVDEMEAGELEA
jgi:uncharacterized UBP type Zn finger protein